MLGELNRVDMDDILERNFVGQLGCNDGKRSYIVPINYIYDGNFLLAHSMEGMKIDMMRKNPEVCFSVYEMKDNFNWTSVILWGQFEELTEERERNRIIKIFTDRMLKFKVFPSFNKERKEVSNSVLNYPASARPVLFRIIIQERTGRFERN